MRAILTILSIAFLLCSSLVASSHDMKSDCEVEKTQGKYKIVFVDGIFDLAHYGHQQVIQNAINEGVKFFQTVPENIRVIVGVSGTDEEIANYKRPSVYSIAEKMRQMSGFKGVHKVVNSAMVTTRAFMQEHCIDLVVAGSDYADLERARKYYADAIDMERFVTFPRTEGISTSDIMRRTATRVAEIMEKNATDQRDVEVIRAFLELMKTHF